MQDGKQNVPFDRILMRVKDITSIISSILTIITVIMSALWLGFKQMQSTADNQRMIAEVITRLPANNSR